MHVGLGVSLDVVEFQKAPLGTPVAVFVDECAASSVALVDLSLHRVWSLVRRRDDRSGRRFATGVPSDGETLLQDFRNEQVEPLFEDLGEIAVGNAVAQEV